MQMPTLSYLTQLSCLAILLLLWIYFKAKRRTPTEGSVYPPGPKRLPFVGNVRDLPKKHECETYATWAKTYGDIIGLKVLGTPLIILNSFDAAQDLFEKRSSIYSDRTFTTMFELMQLDVWDMIVLPYGDQWRKHRKLFHHQFQPSCIPAIQPLQTMHARNLLRSLLRSPHNFLSLIRGMAGAVQFETSYGSDVTESYLVLADHAAKALDETAKPGAYIVDALPSLKYTPAWFPLAVFKRQALEWRECLHQLRHKPFNDVKTAVASGQFRPSFSSMMLQDFGGLKGYTDEEMAGSAAVAYGAGTDTSSSVIETFFLAMLLFPDVQRKAQLEIDTRLSNERLPCPEDRKTMPYLDALLKETMRWNPTVPLGIPHRLRESNIYEGYHLPAGTIVIGNAWAMLHDERIYNDPFSFIPERYLLKDDLPDPRNMAYGFGRRVCPGKHAADSLIWIVIASVLAVYDILPDLAVNPSQRNQEGLFTSGLFHRPSPFKCVIKARSVEAETLIRESATASV